MSEENPWLGPLLSGLRKDAAEAMLIGEKVPDLVAYSNEFLRGLIEEATHILEVRSNGGDWLDSEN